MKAVVTEHEQMMFEIMEFTRVIVGVAEMRHIPVKLRAETILLAEQLFHKVIMNKMVEKCVEKSIPCNN